jgi:hypothetical protein
MHFNSRRLRRCLRNISIRPWWKAALCPGMLLEWFKKTKEYSKKLEREPLTVEKKDRRLKIKLLHDFTTGDCILVI